MGAGGRGLTRQALAIASLRGVVLGFFLLTAGEWVLGTAVAISAYADGGALAVGLVGFRFAPAAVVSLGTALLGERFGRRRVLTATALTRSAIGALIVGALAAGLPFGPVLALVWLDAAAGSAYRPAQAGLLASLVSTPGQLTAAAVLVSNAKQTGQVLGAIGGGLLIATVSAPSAVLVAVALFVGAALLTTIASRDRVRSARPGSGGLRENLAQMRAGLAALGKDGDTRRIALWSCARSLVRGLWVSLGVVACLTILGMGESGFGLLMAAAGGGTLLSVPLTARLVGRRLLARPFAIGLALCCLPFAAIGLVGSAAPALALMVAWGIGMTLADVGAAALLHRVVVAREQARVVGLMESAKLLAEGLGCLVAPALVALFGIRAALLTAGLSLFALLVADARGFRSLDRRAVGRVDLLELVRGVALFAPLRVDGLEAVVAPLAHVELPAGHDVIRQDDAATRWHVVAAGELDVIVDGYAVNRVGRGESFGERGLLRAEPHSATVRAVTDVELLALDRDAFLRAVTGAEDVEAATLAAPRGPREALRRQPLLSALEGAAIDELVRDGTTLALASDEPLFAQGERDDRYFVVLQGAIEIRVDGEPRRVLAPGDGFGEIAVLHEVGRTTSAVALAPSSLVAVPGDCLRARLRPQANPEGA